MTDPDSYNHSVLKINLDTYNNILISSIRLQKKQYYEAFFSKYKNNIKQIWKLISEVIGKTKQKKRLPPFFQDENGLHITDKLEIANKFNNIFVDIAKKLADNLVNDGQRIFTDFPRNKISSKIKFYDIEKEHIIKIINDMKPKTSSCYDGISMKIIKSVKNTLADPLAMIINQILHTCIFPDLKIAKVTPIYKKDDETIFSNYRSISLLLIISKKLEKIIFSQTYEYFQREKLFYEGQYGFRKGHSTEFAALEIVDKLMTDMDKGETPINII